MSRRRESLLRASFATDAAIIAIGVATLAGAFLIDIRFTEKQTLLTAACLTILLLVVLRMGGLVQAAHRARDRAEAFAAVGGTTCPELPSLQR